MRLMGLLMVGMMATFHAVPVVQAQGDSSEVVEWSLDEIRSLVGAVRAGRDLSPRSWPGGARVAVLLSFDSDNETVYLRFGEQTVGKLSEGEFGARVGLKRVVDLVDKHEIPASFFIPAVSLELAPHQAEWIMRSGRHEVGVHGWIHENPASIRGEKERELVERSIATITKMTGQRPVGFRAPSWNFSEHTFEIIRELGFMYDSSLMADDRPYELLDQGEATGMIELPVSWIPDDASYLIPRAPSGIAPRDFYTIIRDDFDKAYEEGTIFLLTMHPHVIGRRSAIVVLEELIDYMKSKPGVWFATHRQAAEYVAKEAGFDLSSR